MIKSVIFFYYLCFLSEESFDQVQYKYSFATEKSALSYSYEKSKKSDSVFLVGRLIDKESREPIYNMNITVAKTRIGTVPKIDGTFKIYLPNERGIIIFDKINFDRFELKFKFKD